MKTQSCQPALARAGAPGEPLARCSPQKLLWQPRGRGPWLPAAFGAQGPRAPSPSAAASHPAGLAPRLPGLSSSCRAGPEGGSQARWPPGQLHPGVSACRGLLSSLCTRRLLSRLERGSEGWGGQRGQPLLGVGGGTGGPESDLPTQEVRGRGPALPHRGDTPSSVAHPYLGWPPRLP